MSHSDAFFADLAQETPSSDKGILSRTLHNDERVNAVIFGFAQGEEPSEHAASMPAILQFIRGEARSLWERTLTQPSPAHGFTCQLG